jgi:hypothetical protein
MKLLTRTLTLLTITCLALFFANCGGDDGEGTPVEKTQLGKLTGTWVIVSATLQGGLPPDKTTEYAGFELTLEGTFDADNEDPFPYDYTTSNRPDLSPWPAIGNWGFGSNPKTQVVRDDSMGITYSIASNGNLTLMYNYTGAGEAGRTAEVEGNWTLVLEPQ